MKKEIKKNITIISEENDKSLKQIEKYIKIGLKNLKEFYEIDHPKINIELFYSRREFNKKNGHTTPDWLVGSVCQNNIYLFSPFVIEKVSPHKKAEFKKILIHELSHIFNHKINKNIILWIDEGIAIFLANQEKNKYFSKEDLNFFLDNFLNNKINLNMFAKKKWI